jgi:hypothetical protein
VPLVCVHMIHVYLGILMIPMVWCHGTPHHEASCPFGAQKRQTGRWTQLSKTKHGVPSLSAVYCLLLHWLWIMMTFSMVKEKSSPSNYQCAEFFAFEKTLKKHIQLINKCHKVLYAKWCTTKKCQRLFHKYLMNSTMLLWSIFRWLNNTFVSLIWWNRR